MSKHEDEPIDFTVYQAKKSEEEDVWEMWRARLEVFDHVERICGIEPGSMAKRALNGLEPFPKEMSDQLEKKREKEARRKLFKVVK